MKQSICILGRQPELGLAELESLLGPKALTPLSTNEAVLVNQPIDKKLFNRLGGTVKVAKLLHEFKSTSWRQIDDYLQKNIPNHLKFAPEGKLNFGLSAFGLKISPKDLQRTGLSLKKLIKSHGHSVRLVPTKGLSLSSAQVIHNKLNQGHWELIFVQDGRRILMGLTVHEQDIEAYAKRDQARPKRDARVGMLPPKLAQIIINLSVGDADPKYGQTILDPFCGTGVVLQEAKLMGFAFYGSDIEPRMVDYARQNLVWLTKQPWSNIKSAQAELIVKNLIIEADATSHQWAPSANFIAGETYLGRPFSALPDSLTLNKVMQDVDTIHKKFLRNVAGQTKPGFRLALAVPAWKKLHGFHHLKTLDSLEELGYTRMSFKHVRGGSLVYHRDKQIVGRELVVLVRK